MVKEIENGTMTRIGEMAFELFAIRRFFTLFSSSVSGHGPLPQTLKMLNKRSISNKIKKTRSNKN